MMKVWLKRFFEASYFFSNVLIPLTVLALYCAIFAYFSYRYQLDGVNFVFASRSLKYVLALLTGATLIFLLLLRSTSYERLDFKSSKEEIYWSDLLLLLLPLTSVVQYILNNQDILSPAAILYVLTAFILFSGLLIFAIPILLRSIMPTRTLMIVGVAFVFTIVNMALLSEHFTWFESGSLRIQLLVLGGLFLVLWLLYNLNQRKVLYLFIVLNFLVNSSAQLWTHQNGGDRKTFSVQESKLLSLVADRAPVITPNIYLLIYDAYVPNETLLSYGIDNSQQENYLHDQGFTFYPHTYSIGSSSISTMSRVLNASTEFYGDTRRAVSGDGVTHKIFHDLGYKTYGLFVTDFMFRGIGSSYDVAIPESDNPPHLLLTKAIFLGEFRFDIENVGISKKDRNQFVETKRRIFEDVAGKQVFIYMHSNLPSHSQNSGVCRPNETDLFAERLSRANVEMRQDLDVILANDPDSIVIVAGDHGPYLTKNCDSTTNFYDISEISRLDIQDRHGTFLAIRWPTGDFIQYDDITVLQDVFPAVFAYLFKDPTILKAKIEPMIPIPNNISGASVNNGIIQGGINDGEPLYLSGNQRMFP